MDPSSFDRLSRLLARASSRRAVLAAVVAGLSGAVALDDADAGPTCVAGGATCKTDGQCCSGRCRLVGGGGVRRVCDCEPGTARCDGRCVRIDTVERCGRCDVSCRSGEECCGGRCRALRTDEKNCGACGNVCAAGETCCRGTCVDLTESKNNCGACGKVCGGSKICCDGVCRAGSTDENNCGACGHVCAAGETCCGGACVDLQNTDDHCTACNKRCADGKSCCNGACVDTEINENHCGACNAGCPAGKSCLQGACLTTSCARPPQNSGDCGSNRDCWITSDGSTHYGFIRGRYPQTCHGEEASPCYTGHVCVVNFNTAFGENFTQSCVYNWDSCTPA